MLTQRFPYPPNRGDRIRSYNLLRFLSQHFEICLGCTSDEAVSSQQLAHVQSICQGVAVGQTSRLSRISGALRSTALGQSLTEGFFRNLNLARAISQMHQTKRFDVVLVFCSSMYPYVQRAKLTDLPVVVDLVDVDSCKWSQLSQSAPIPKNWLYALEAKRVKKLERRIAAEAFALVLVSDDEAQLFRQEVVDHGRLFGISNGVDTAYFSPNPENAHDSSGPVRLVFTGVLDYVPNVDGVLWFCREVLPILQSQLEVQLDVVGRSPNSAIKKLGQNPSIRIVGEVPDVRPYLRTADIAISPLHLARGIQNKVLEAMASGLPVVLTPQSAEGVSAVHKRHFYVAHSAQDFADGVRYFAASSEKRAEFALAARQLVQTKYSWSARLAPFRELIEQSVLHARAVD